MTVGILSLFMLRKDPIQFTPVQLEKIHSQLDRLNRLLQDAVNALETLRSHPDLSDHEVIRLRKLVIDNMTELQSAMKVDAKVFDDLLGIQKSDLRFEMKGPGRSHEKAFEIKISAYNKQSRSDFTITLGAKHSKSSIGFELLSGNPSCEIKFRRESDHWFAERISQKNTFNVFYSSFSNNYNNLSQESEHLINHMLPLWVAVPVHNDPSNGFVFFKFVE